MGDSYEIEGVLGWYLNITKKEPRGVMHYRVSYYKKAKRRGKTVSVLAYHDEVSSKGMGMAMMQPLISFSFSFLFVSQEASAFTVQQLRGFHKKFPAGTLYDTNHHINGRQINGADYMDHIAAAEELAYAPGVGEEAGGDGDGDEDEEEGEGKEEAEGEQEKDPSPPTTSPIDIVSRLTQPLPTLTNHSYSSRFSPDSGKRARDSSSPASTQPKKPKVLVESSAPSSVSVLESSASVPESSASVSEPSAAASAPVPKPADSASVSSSSPSSFDHLAARNVLIRHAKIKFGKSLTDAVERDLLVDPMDATTNQASSVMMLLADTGIPLGILNHILSRPNDADDYSHINRLLLELLQTKLQKVGQSFEKCAANYNEVTDAINSCALCLQMRAGGTMFMYTGPMCTNSSHFYVFHNRHVVM